MNTRTRNTTRETSFANTSPSGTDAERLFTDLPGAGSRSFEDEAIVASFAEAGLTVEIVDTCGDVSCHPCFGSLDARAA